MFCFAKQDFRLESVSLRPLSSIGVELIQNVLASRRATSGLMVREPRISERMREIARGRLGRELVTSKRDLVIGDLDETESRPAIETKVRDQSARALTIVIA